MAYATQSDVQAAIGSDMLLLIADHNGDGAVDADVVTRALDEATSLADSYLISYLPISPTPAVLRRAIVDIAGQHMRIGRGQVTEDSTLAYNAAIKWLTAVSNGTASLGTETENTIDPGDPEIDVEDRVWTRALSAGVF